MKLLNRLRPRVIFIVILVIYLDGFLLISPTAEINAAYRGISGSSILVEHDYDPISDSVVSWSLKAGESIGQSFTVPSGITSVDGFCVKLLRVGPVPPLEYQIENKWGDGNLSSGKILSNDVEVFFERWVRVNLSRPVRVEPGRQYYIHIHAANGPEAGYYELFGTASARIDKPNFKMKFQDVPAWGNAPSAPSGFENPINLDYGMKTPRYEGGAAISADGTLIEPLDFAIRILGQKSKGKDVASRNDSSPVAKDREGIASPEERFSFIDELLAPPHEKSIRVGSSLRSNEFELTRDWSLLYTSEKMPVVDAAVADFQRFLEIGLGVKIGIRAVSGFESTKIYSKSILAGTRRDFPWITEGSTKSEGFLIEASPERIVLCGYDDRGVMRGLQYFEDILSFRKAPILETFREVRAPLYSPRITCAPFYTKLELDAASDPYTDELLSRISHYGFNAIWIWGELSELGRSSTFPELSENVERRQRRLNEIIERAERRGLDVYLYLANKPLPKSFFENHSEVRGSPLKAYGGDYVLCTSAPKTQKYIREVTQDLFRSVPRLRGAIFIVGGEGFFHCYTRKLDCPRCSLRSPQDVVAELARAIDEGVRSGRPDADVVLWPYSASSLWSKDDIYQSKLIDKLPPTITFQTEFAKEGLIRFGGITIPAYDYPISFIGPSERFSAQATLAKNRGLKLWVKTEESIALEFIQTPFIPAYFRWGERFRRIHEVPDVKGIFANWNHYGFTPSIASEVFKWHTWSPLPGTEDILRKIARRNFGPRAEDHALRAWREWSEAIQQYPFSRNMVMGPIQKGPAHPLFLDPGYKPVHNSGRQFRNDLSWTEPWGADLALEQLKKLEEGWGRGIAEWEKVILTAEPELRINARREGDIAQGLLFCIRSALNVGRFYQIRDRLWQEKNTAVALDLIDQLVKVAQAELANSRQALEVVSRDSRLGYANSGVGETIGATRGGIYSPRSIEKKIYQVEHMLNKEIPEYRLKRSL